VNKQDKLGTRVTLPM